MDSTAAVSQPRPAPSEKQHDGPWRRYFGFLISTFQRGADFAVVVACFQLGYLLYTSGLSRSSPQSFIEFALISAGIGLVYVLILDRVGLYEREISLLNIQELRGIFRTGFYAAAVVLSLSFYLRSVDLSRITMTTGLVLSPFALYIQRQIFYRLHVLFHLKGWSQRKVLIYGAGNIGTHLAKRLFESPALGLLPVGMADDNPLKHQQWLKWSGIGPNKGLKVLGGEEWIDQASQLGVELVLIALPSATFERNQKLVERCIQAGVDYAIVPNAYERFIQNVELFEIGGIPILRRKNSRVSFYFRVLKKLVDFALSSLFILLLSPLILLFGLSIRLDSRGPVLFKQKRVGLRGRQFSIYKFRTMHVEAPRYARTPSDPHDPRITRVGKWLRRTSLDELPQLFNVFRGDMSLVGPRPEMPFIVEGYTALERQRLLVKPGITGVWQISAVRGEPIHQNLEYDLFYIHNQSLLLDLSIIVKTILSVVRGVGAV